MVLSDTMASVQVSVEACLNAALDPVSLPLAEAMLYACKGGKGLRGFLASESAALFGLTTDLTIPVAAAVEAIHAYSLIHDDLPAMDNDDIRRGQPTVHRKWDEATAVLAGDALQALAFEMILGLDAPADARVTLAKTLAEAAGIRGMVGGQALDIAAETSVTPLTLEAVQTLQAGKTGALITWSAAAGARLAGENPAPLVTYGQALGLAFQIWDDVLDHEGDAKTVGKAVGKDARAGKATFLSLMGPNAAKALAQEKVDEACEALAIYGQRAHLLRELAQFVVTRDH